jgi:membrane fusion protein, heavy metal efflux system
MNRPMFKLICCLFSSLFLASCEKPFDPASGAASPAQVIQNGNAGLVSVDNPAKFPVAAAQRLEAHDTINVTGSVNPDIAREVPVISLANGRVVDIRARLGDNVKKSQLIMRVQSQDVASAYDTYLKAANDEELANKAYIRAKDLYAHGAIALENLEQAEDVARDAKADLDAAGEQLITLGVPKDHPSSILNVYAPISGVIVAQNVTNAAAAGVTLSGSPTAFTVADLSVVWIICDVYENDLPRIHLGQAAKIRLTAYPDKLLIGRVSDIGPVLDPTIRTAKVRIEVSNPGVLRLGMYVTAELESRQNKLHAAIPTSAILHLRDRDWVFVPADGNKFKRVEVSVGATLPGRMQEIVSGVEPGQQVVSDVIALEETLEAQ